MQRLIKFRVWDLEEKRWISGPCEYVQLDKVFSLNEGKWYQDDWVFQQFTGLLDKNGKEIYEGDIILKLVSPYFAAGENDEYLQWVNKGKPTKKWYRLVKYDGFVIRPFSEGLTYPLKPKDIEVVGNIFETPELLK